VHTWTTAAALCAVRSAECRQVCLWPDVYDADYVQQTQLLSDWTLSTGNTWMSWSRPVHSEIP
jgi:hypothetical protein